MLANRLSFTLGTVGPSMTVDTACSSSLVALRQACLHLRGGGGSAGEKGSPPRVALVGGVNLLLSPSPFDLFSKVTFFKKKLSCCESAYSYNCESVLGRIVVVLSGRYY